MASDNESFCIFSTSFSPLWQSRLNEFGNYFAKKAGIQPQLIYTLGEVNEILNRYREKHYSAGCDEKVIEYEEEFLWEIIKAGQPKCNDPE